MKEGLPPLLNTLLSIFLLAPLFAGYSPFGGKSPLIPPYKGGRQMERKQRCMDLYIHPLPFVRGELERDFSPSVARVGKDN